MNNSSLSCSKISKYFFHRMIFADVNFTLNSGSSLGLTGMNGSGKSTLIKIIAGLISTSLGETSLTINNKLLSKEDHFRHIGFMSPYLNLYDELSGEENLSFFINIKCPNLTKTDKNERINFLLDRVGLVKSKKDLYKNYSSGMKQRLKLAFALLNEPQLLLLDEPCANLDVEGIDVIYNFSEEQKKKGMLIIATNEPSDLKLCDSLLNIEDFKIKGR